MQYEQGLGASRILAIATQGEGSGDAERLKTLLSRLPFEMDSFDRGKRHKAFLQLMRKLFRDRPGLVVMEGTGIAGGLAVILARLFWDIPYVVSSGDAVGPYMRKFHPILGVVFSLYERILCKFCSGFIGWTPYLVGRALTFGAPKAMTAAGWAPFDGTTEELRLARARVRREARFEDDDIVVGIVGSLSWNKRVGYCYGYELVKAVLETRRTNIKVLIVGDGDGRKVLEKLAGRELGRRICFSGRVPREEVPDYLAAMDVASLPQSADQVGSFRYTTKISEYLAVGLPIVTGHLPLAYDFPAESFWRLRGAAPWHPEYLEALARWMDGLSFEELSSRHPAAQWQRILFNRAFQINGVTDFIKDILHNQLKANSASTKTTYVSSNRI